MNLPIRIALFGIIASVGVHIYADNPISNYHYLADPAATADDETFYILTDSDDPAGSNGYTIKSLYGFSSKDMKNWTDHGIIFEAKREYDNVNDIWASGIDIAPDGTFYIVYPDGGGGGVGLIGAKNFSGPWENPIPGNKKLINNWGGGLADCDGIGWCFDPAIYFDTDGSGYFTFGGGSSDSRPAAENNNNIFNIYKFNSDMKGFDINSKVQLKIGGPKAMEASYIHKKGSLYYLSYSTTDLRIAYGTSTNVKGPYTYKGVFMDNPNINGQNINAHNNNHHGIAEFKGKWYAVYHDRRLVKAAEHPASLGVANPEPAFHRSVSIDELTYNGDNLNKLVYTNEGPKQIANFDPYQTYPAITSSLQRNIRSRTDWTRGQPVKHVLTPYSTKESWIRVSGVDFGSGATNFIVTAASVASGNKIEIRSGSVSGTLAGSCDLPQTSGWNAYETTECAVDGLTGVVNQLFLVFKGSKDSTMGILEWEFSGAPSAPQSAYNGVVASIPGKIEAENYDEGGARKAYSDEESENQGDASFRAEEGVDIVAIPEGKAVGYTVAGEWLEYSVNVKSAGDQTFTARVSSGSESSSFMLFLDDVAISDTIKIPQGADWDTYTTVTGNLKTVTTGDHILKILITGSYVNLDWIYMGEEPPTGISKQLNLGALEAESTFNVFTVQGKQVAQFKSSSLSNLTHKTQMVVEKPGVYLVKAQNTSKVYRVFVSKKGF